MANKWLINGMPVFRNPDSFSRKYDKTNATYTKMADGSQRRIDVPNLITAIDIEMGWMTSDEANRTYIMSLLNLKGMNSVEIIRTMPRRAMYVYFDTPENIMTAEAGFSDMRSGQSGMRNNLKLVGRTDTPWDKSVATIPLAANANQSVIDAGFGIPPTLGIGTVPKWNGNPWDGIIVNGTNSFNFSNLGTAQWSPIIKFSGPFTSLSLVATYEDVDGTGAGVAFNYIGASVLVGDYILFDTARQRCYLSVSGVLAEVFGFNVIAVATAIPYPYFPPLQPGDSNLSVTCLGGDSFNTRYDLTNVGTEKFRYW